MQPTKVNRTERFFNNVQEGMHVHDPAGKHVGSVKFIHYGEEDVTTPEATTVTGSAPQRSYEPGYVTGLITLAFGDDHDLPEELQQQMVREGYIRIDTGVLRSDRVALASQIASLSGDVVTLNVGWDDLVRA
jgi:hypothetical protein